MDRGKGMILSVFIGDSMGSAYEFPKYSLIEDSNAIHQGKLTNFRRLKRFSNNYTFYEKGNITDDSILTIELLTSLSKKETKYQRLKRYYNAVKKNSSFGKNTRALFKNLRYEENYFNQFGVYPPELALNNPESNGCLMRCTPLAFCSIDEIEDKIIEDVMITNPSKNCIDVVFAYIYLLRCGLECKDPLDSLIKLKEKVTNSLLIEILDICFERETFPEISDYNKKGWIFISFYYAITALFKFIDGLHFNQIIPWIVLQGGDTDTNAAISGGLLGSFIGYNELMNDFITEENSHYVKKNVDWENIEQMISSLL